jgi:hypothetical protein
LNDAPKNGPCHATWLALLNLAAHLEKRWVIVTQRVLLERIKGNSGRTMSRRTLNRRLLGLELHGLIRRVKRHQRNRHTGQLHLKATLYTFPKRAILWIKRIRRSATIPLGRLAVPKMAQSRYNPSRIRARDSVDKAPPASRARRRRKS